MHVKAQDGLWPLVLLIAFASLCSYLPLQQSGTVPVLAPLCRRASDDGKYDVELFAHLMTSSGYEAFAADERVTFLVMHMTIDRLASASRWCHQWRGPISLAFFIRPQDSEPNVTERLLLDKCLVRYANVHIVRPRLVAQGRPLDMMVHYPFNVQRNAALDGALLPDEAIALFSTADEEPLTFAASFSFKLAGDRRRRRMLARQGGNVTHNVFLLDIDFHLVPAEPSAGSERNFTKYVEQSFLKAKRLSRHSPMALVIPAVETVVKSVRRAGNISDLRQMVKANEICAFYGHYCRPCHLPTRLEQFVSGVDRPYLAVYEEGYEPYVVIKRTVAMSRSSATARACSTTFWSSLPRYDESFVGRGWDKMSFFYELHHILRTPFVVVPGPYFLVHVGRGDMPAVLSAEYQNRQEENLYLWMAFKDRIAKRQQAILLERATTSDELKRLLPRDDLLWDSTRELLNWKELDLTMGFRQVCQPVEEATDQQLIGMLEFICGQEGIGQGHLPVGVNMSCTTLNELAHFFPSSVRVHASWAVDRYFHRAVAAGESPATACNFSGLAALGTCSSPLAGCSLSRTATDDDVDKLLDALCSGPGAFFKNCTTMWRHVSPLVRNARRVQAAVAANARHMILRCASADVKAQHGATTAFARDDTCRFRGWTRLVAPYTTALQPL